MTPVRVVTSLQTNSSVASTSASRIRSRFLHRLGIKSASPHNLSHEKTTPCKVVLVSSTYTPRVRRAHCSGNHVNHQTTVLSSGDASLQNSTSATSLTLLANNNERRKRGVTFHDEVTIHPIPTRYEFSDRVRKLLWSTPQELQINAVRNAVEFAAEGWDWRNVILDHEMMRNSLTGELVHPIHFYMKREFNLQQHFVHVMAARAGYHAPDHRNNYNNVRKYNPPRPQPSCVAISM